MNTPITLSTKAIILDKNGYIETRGVKVLKLDCEEDGTMYKINDSWHLERDLIITNDRIHLLSCGKDVLIE